MAPPRGDEDLRIALQHLQWRKKMTESKIKSTIEANRARATQDLIDQLSVDRSVDNARWRVSVIADEMSRPLYPLQ